MEYGISIHVHLHKYLPDGIVKVNRHSISLIQLIPLVLNRIIRIILNHIQIFISDSRNNIIFFLTSCYQAYQQ